jgi:hypothetical protein
MTVTITTPATSALLTTVGAVKRELGADVDDQLVESLVRAASEVVSRYCGRSFGREVLSETVSGYGGQHLMLARTPIVTTAAVLHEGSPIIDYVVGDSGAGLLYRKQSWLDTTEVGWYMSEYRRSYESEPQFTVTYTAGYLLPSDDVVSALLTASAADNSFNLTGASFPLLVAGDTVTTADFPTAANNGTFTVVSRTASKVVVSGGTLATDAADPNSPRTMAVRTLPYDIERAVIETVKAWYFARTPQASVASKTVGDLSIHYRAPADSSEGLPSSAIGLLAPYRRFA